MYDYMKGFVTDIRPEGITLEVNNIGYFINVANPYTFEINKDTTVYLHQQIKEDEHKIDYSKVSLKELDEEELYLLITLTNMSLDELKEYTHKQMASGHTR